MHRICVLAVLSAISVGCSAKPYRATFEKPSLSGREGPSEEEARASAVVIRVKPVTRENMAEFPEIVRQVTWREPNRNSPVSMGGGTQASAATVPVTEKLSLVQLPAFQLVIENRGEAPVSLKSVELEDGKGKSYSLVEDQMERVYRSELTARARSPYIVSDTALLEWLRTESRSLPVATKDVKVAPKTAWRGYALFDLGAYGADDYYAFMKTVPSFTVRVTTTGDAGTQSYVFEKRVEPIPVTCPGEVKEPSLERCTPAQEQVSAAP